MLIGGLDEKSIMGHLFFKTSFFFLLSTRSTCMRRKVGAMLVKDKHIISSGFNGCPSGLRHCDDVGCLRSELNVPAGKQHELCRGVHAEQNAIIQAAVFGVSISGSVLYCTNFPCSICAKMIINAKISKIIYIDGYPDSLSEDLLCESGIEISKFGGSNRKYVEVFCYAG